MTNDNVARWALLVSCAAWIAACATAPPPTPEPTPTSPPPATSNPVPDAARPSQPTSPTTPAPPAGARADAAPATQGDEPWPFVQHAVRSCFVDRLGWSAYMKWYAPQMWGLRKLMRPGDPKPSPGLVHPKRGPEPGGAGFDEARQEVIDAMTPEGDGGHMSHVLDCAFRFPWPPGNEEGEVSRAIPYVIYLPADYLENPNRRRPLLVLFPGGRGNRTRWFLIPLDYRFGEKGSGGVKMRWRMDDWAARNPGAPTPLVVSINGPGVYGAGNDVNFVSDLLPNHILRTFLPHQDIETTPYGLETISSSGGIGVRALYAHPTRINVLGLNCLACMRAGLIPDNHLGPPEERAPVTQLLAERKREGVLDMRFSIGDADSYLGCNRNLYEELLAVGFWERRRDPEFIECSPTPRRLGRKHRCVRSWPGFYLYPRIGHTYRLLYATIDRALDWNASLLVDMLPRLAPDDKAE